MSKDQPPPRLAVGLLVLMPLLPEAKAVDPADSDRSPPELAGGGGVMMAVGVAVVPVPNAGFTELFVLL
jgi:hypothetical protein